MRQEAYRVAFEEANWELKDIVGQFDLLSSRKDQIERVVDVLKPFVSFGIQTGSEIKADPGTEPRFESAVSREGKGYGSAQARSIRQEAYRMAFEEANMELKEFVLKFEQLRFRKEQIEKLCDVLRPLLSQVSPVAALESGAQHSEPVHVQEPVQEVAEHVEAPAVEAAPTAEETASDPFQRRSDAPVSVAAGGKDLRDYSRLFSSSMHRR